MEGPYAIGDWLEVQELPPIKGRKTKRWSLRTREGAELGLILWHSGWRRYVLQAPTTGDGAMVVLEAGCLEAVAKFLREVHEERVR